MTQSSLNEGLAPDRQKTSVPSSALRSLKRIVKRALFGPPGKRAYSIKRGLLKGLRFTIDPSNKSLRLIGFDEREIAADTRRFAAQAVTALDIGANDGWYALYFATQPNIKKVYAFEPEESLRRSLSSNFTLNSEQLLEKVEVVSKLVGNQDNERWCSIDQLLPDLPRPAVFKIDVDGGEMDVFRGAQKTLSKDGCMIVLETHSAELERECDQFLKNLGYTTRIVFPGWYRKLLPEGRIITHNRWLIASRS
jgi:hypothetical protein